MRASRYNQFLRAGDGCHLAFNAASAALAEIDPASYQRIQQILAGTFDADSPDYRTLIDQLSSASFLVPDDFDEVAWLRAQNRLRRYGNRTLFLTIAPTLACNFACDYCFESHGGARMNTDTIDALLAFADRHLKHAEGLAITWFGGEPTLCLDIIEQVQHALGESAARYEIPCQPASIITNGYLLDGAMAKRLREAGVTAVQITLDGPQPMHDLRRPLKNGGGTFRRIIENLCESSAYLNIVVRANIDTDNMTQADQIIDSLNSADLLGRLNVYFAQVTAPGTACADMRGRCLTTEEFSERQVDLYRNLIDRGFTRIEYPSLAAGGHCGADSAYSYVIAPNGLLFKCWEELGLDDTNSVGSLFSDELTQRQRQNQTRYYNWDPFEKPGCVACEVLPICMGGCPHQGLVDDNPHHGYCCSWKFNLREMLLLRYLCHTRKEVNT